MHNKKVITVLTPTYNRSEKIYSLYNSLKMQTNFNFQWVIVDDGSIDDTQKKISGFDEDKFSIRYFYKENGGKHTAINFAMKHIDSELTMVVDSDDVLTNDAIDTVINEWRDRKESGLAGLILLKQDTKGRVSGFKFPKQRFINNYNTFILNNPNRQENADVWVTDILKKFPYPEFDNERYVAETTVWAQISKNYDMLFVNKVIYIFSYQEDGLTNTGRKLRVDNPKGSMENAKVFLSEPFTFKLRMKKMILYIAYGKFAKENFVSMYKSVPDRVLYLIFYPIGSFLYCIWKSKHSNSL